MFSVPFQFPFNTAYTEVSSVTYIDIYVACLGLLGLLMRAIEKSIKVNTQTKP